MYHIQNVQKNLIALALAAASIVSMSAMNPASAATAEDLDMDSRKALQTLYEAEPVAETLSRTAKAVLVFPNIVVVIVVVLWLLQVCGVLGSLDSIRIGR